MTTAALEATPSAADAFGRCEIQESPTGGRCGTPTTLTCTASCPCGHVKIRAVCNLHNQHLHQGLTGCIECWQADGHICRVSPGADRG